MEYKYLSFVLLKICTANQVMNVTEEERKEEVIEDIEVTAGEETREEPAEEKPREEDNQETAGEESTQEETPAEEEKEETVEEKVKEEEPAEESKEEEAAEGEGEEKISNDVEVTAGEDVREEPIEEEEPPQEEKKEGEGNFTGGLPKPVKIGDELEVTIESVGAKGDGIAKKDGFVIFIAGVQKGESVKIKITELKTSFAIGEKI